MDIVCTNLSKSYGSGCVLDSFSHSFPGGQTTLIMGPSGRGKTTLLRLILGLETPTSGSIEGLEAYDTRCAAVFQEDCLCESLSVATNLRLVAPDLRAEDIEDMLQAMQLSCKPHDVVSALSGGMKRRVALARALVAQPSLLVMDEPFKGLDEQTKDAVMRAVAQKTKGMTVLLVTHDRRECAYFPQASVLEL